MGPNSSHEIRPLSGVILEAAERDEPLMRPENALALA